MKRLLLALALTTISTLGHGAWKLDNQQSHLSFISTKNAQVSEMHHFTQLSGSLSEAGMIKVQVAIASVETAIPIRNERMQKFLFNDEKATFEAQLSDKVMAMKAGQVMKTEVEGTVTINGKAQQHSITVSVTKDLAGQYIATTTKPFFIKAAEYELSTGIEKLQQLAGLNSITLTVPVSFNVTFSQ